MQSLLAASRLLLPAAFLGYGLYANYAVLTGEDAAALARVEGSVLHGGATARFDEIYAGAMPHREVATAWIGLARFIAIGEGRRGVTVGEGGWLFTDEEMDVASGDEVAHMAWAVVEARDRLVEMGVRLIVVPVPAKADIERGHLGRDGAADRMADQHDDFLAALARVGVEAVDVRPALVDARAAGVQTFLARDTHWTPEGASVAAEAFAASGLVTPGEIAFARRAVEPEIVEGDLVRFVTAGRLASRAGLEPEAVTPFVAEAAAIAESIFAVSAPTFSTILVGTSYSADARWSFAPALSLALGRDVLNLAVEGQGPIRPMLALLDGPALVENVPDTVIWEIPVRSLGDPSIWPDDLQADAGPALEGVQ